MGYGHECNAVLCVWRAYSVRCEMIADGPVTAQHPAIHAAGEDSKEDNECVCLQTARTYAFPCLSRPEPRFILRTRGQDGRGLPIEHHIDRSGRALCQSFLSIIHYLIPSHHIPVRAPRSADQRTFRDKSTVRMRMSVFLWTGDILDLMLPCIPFPILFSPHPDTHTHTRTRTRAVVVCEAHILARGVCFLDGMDGCGFTYIPRSYIPHSTSHTLFETRFCESARSNTYGCPRAYCSEVAKVVFGKNTVR
jgi:hypothetical protein